MKRGYDIIAPFYEFLSSIVFQNSIKNSQKFLINKIEPNSKILIIGGGAGWIIKEICEKYSSGLHITYVDLSSRMISLSEKKNKGKNIVEFINKSVHNVNFNKEYNVVITPFFLDNFSTVNLKTIMDKINDGLMENGLWLYADFQIYNNRKWQKILLRIMYIFFKIFCNIEANSLAETRTFFKEKKFKIILSKKFYSDFICSIIYQKQ